MRLLGNNMKTAQSQQRTLLWQRVVCCLLAWMMTLPEPTVLIGNSTAIAQTYVLGARKYAKGDIKGAEAALIQATKHTRNRAELAKVYKLLGITQFMQNKKPQAAGSFKTALSIDPRLTIKPDEVLDESVIPYFEAQRKATRPVAAAPRRAPTPPPKAPAAAPARKTGPTYGKPLNTTILVVTSNAPKGQISIDGILAGQVGDRIETQAGTTVLQMKAPGYRTKNFKVTIRANRENRFALNLDKIQPKAPPASVAGTPARGGKKVGKMKASDSDMFRDSEPEYPTMGGGDLMSEFKQDGVARAPAPVTPPAPVVSAPAPAAPAPLAPPAPVAPQYPQAQPYSPQAQPYPPQAQPYPQQPQYAPQYQQAPAAQAPIIVVQPPAPAYPYPPQYAAPMAPAPLPPPATDLYSDFQAPPAAAPSYEKPLPPLTPTRSRRRSQGDSALVTIGLLMPFGVGQFVNGDTMSGLIFAGAQIGSLYFYHSSLTAADTATKNAEAVIQSSDFSNDEKDTFLTDTEKYVNAQKQNANIGIGLFGVAWIAGSVEAFLTRSSRKESPKRRYSLIEDGLLPKASGEVLEELYVAAPEPYAPPVSFGLLPNVKSDGVDWGIGVKIDWRF